MKKAVLIVVAGGAARRFGGEKLLTMLHGKPVLIRTLEQLAPAAKRVVLVVPEKRSEKFLSAVKKYLPDLKITVTTGGAERPESVRRGVEAARLKPGEVVAIHDGARPLADAKMLKRLCRRALEVGGAVPGFPQADAQKQCDADGIITGDLPRSGVWNVGTPQVFKAEILLKGCQSEYSFGALDDAEAVRRAGGSVAVLPVKEPNIKLTTRADLKLLEELWAEK